jgi:hypothetical protein
MYISPFASITLIIDDSSSIGSMTLLFWKLCFDLGSCRSRNHQSLSNTSRLKNSWLQCFEKTKVFIFSSHILIEFIHIIPLSRSTFVLLRWKVSTTCTKQNTMERWEVILDDLLYLASMTRFVELNFHSIVEFGLILSLAHSMRKWHP